MWGSSKTPARRRARFWSTCAEMVPSVGSITALRKGSAAAAILLMLAGCQASPRSAASLAASCEFTKVVEYPLSPADAVPFIPVVLNNHRVLMLFDTGSEGTSISEDAAVAIGLSVDPATTTTSMDITGVATHGHLAPLRNSRLVANYPLLGRITVAGHLRAANHRVTGLIGRDVLRNFDLDIDLPHQRIALYRPRRCPAQRPNLGGQITELPQTSAGPGRKLPPNVVIAALDGVAQKTMIDTGASVSVIDRARAAMLRDSSETADVDVASTSMTPSGAMIGVQIHRFADLAVGAERFDRPRMAVVDLPNLDHSGNNQMLLGTDYLRHHRVWISFAGAAVYATGWQPGLTAQKRP